MKTFNVTARLVDDRPVMRIIPGPTVTAEDYSTIHGGTSMMDFNNVRIDSGDRDLYAVLCLNHKPSAVVKGRKNVLKALRAYARAAKACNAKIHVKGHNEYDTEINTILGE